MSLALQFRPMTADEVPAVERIYKLAFGTEFKLDDPLTFRGDAGLVYSRYPAYPDGCIVAVDRDGALVGFAVANRLGTVGVLGPVCVLPSHWNRGIARELCARAVEKIDAWGCRVAGLFTNPASPRHMRLYQGFGFWPRALTVVMRGAATMPLPAHAYQSASRLPRAELLAAAGELTGSAYAGLDLGAEIAVVLERGFGDVLVRTEAGRLAGLAICHFGKLSEAGTAALFVKYAQVRAGAEAAAALRELVRACAARASRAGLPSVLAGVNTGRHHAYRVMLELGFRSEFQGVRMHRPWVPIYDEASSWVLDDWR